MTTISPAPTKMAAPNAPAPPRSRVIGIDAARGLAVLGMMTVHTVFYPSSEPYPSLLAWMVNAPSGRAAVLFFTLSGVALSVIAARGSASSDPDVLRRRGVVLIFFGLALDVWWPSSILQYYGVMFLLAPWLLRMASRTLLTLSALAFAVGPVLVLWMNATIDENTWGSSYSATYFGEQLREILAVEYALPVWCGFFMTGLVLGRLDLGSTRVAWRLLCGGAAGAVLVSTAVAGLSAAGVKADRVADSVAGFPTEQSGPKQPAPQGMDKYQALEDALTSAKGQPPKEGERPTRAELEAQVEALTWTLMNGESTKYQTPPKPEFSLSKLASLTPHSHMTAWALQSLAIACAVLGACLLIASTKAGVLLTPLAIVGSMTLTAYLLHMPFVLEVWNYLVSPEMGRSYVFQSLTLLTMQLAVMGLCVLWWTRWRRGPAERLLGWLTNH